MPFRILAVTHKIPAWVESGFNDYSKRLPEAWSLELISIPAEKRSAQSDLARIQSREAKKILAATKPTHFVVALDAQGKQWSTENLAVQLNYWREHHGMIDLLIGGPEGLPAECLQRADITWSLSLLTFPHALVKIIVAEQIYRAYTILQKHPYHK